MSRPCAILSDNEWLTLMKGRAANFLTTPSSAKRDSQGAPAEVCGSLAVAKLFMDLEAADQANAELDKEKVKQLSTYAYLLAPAQQAQHNRWVQKLYTAAGASSSSKGKGKSKSKPVPAAGASGSKGSSSSSLATATRTSTQGLFKKTKA